MADAKAAFDRALKSGWTPMDWSHRQVYFSHQSGGYGKPVMDLTCSLLIRMRFMSWKVDALSVSVATLT